MSLAVGSTQILAGTCKYYNGNVSSFYQIQLLVKLNSQNVALNKSNVTLTLQVRSINASYATYGSVLQTSIIQGTTLSPTGFDMRDTNVWQTFGTRTFDITHASDGTLTLTMSGSFTTNADFSQYSLRSGMVSGSVAFVTIPRTSAIATFNGFEIGANIPLSLTRYSGSFTDDIVLKVNGATCLSRTGIAASYTITPTDAERELMIVAALDGTITSQLIVTTKSGSTVIGTASKTVSVTLKAGFAPYKTPSISSYDCLRCQEDGTHDVFATFVKFVLNISASSLIYDSGDSETNSLAYQIKYKLRDSSTWTYRDVETIAGLSFDSFEIVAGFPVENSYDVQIVVMDEYNTPMVVDTIPAGKAILWANDEGDGFGAGVKGDDAYNFTAGPKGINSLGGFYENGEPLQDLYLVLDGLIEGYSIETLDSIIGGTF
ncbi:MAG TPA: hypothetical protein DCQ90_06410 [Erysipelotrichaceae bacterium]|nr:hypothetical protein [Erysipelotrichaceae bacterium]